MKLLMRLVHSRNIILCMCALILCACSMETDEPPFPVETDGEHTAVLRFEGSIETFDGEIIGGGKATRATTKNWFNGAVIYLYTTSTYKVYGTATYNSSSKVWTVNYSGTLVRDKATPCKIFYFENPSQTSTAEVTLSAQSAVFADSQASYYYDGSIVTLKATLKPQTARFRLKGAAGTATLQGLKTFSTYTRATGALTNSTAERTLTIATSGYSPYIYCTLADEQLRQLTVKASSTTGYRRYFSTNAFKVGSTGLLTVPTAASHAGWTLVNLNSGKEITVPSISLPTVSDIQSNGAALKATVTSTNNGTIADAGFLVSSPTYTDRKISCGITTSPSTTLTDLSPETTYTVRAYATNEAGTAYSQEIEFTTTKKQAAITFGNLSAINIHSTNVTLTCTVSKSGDVTVSEAGFVLATHTGPTVSDKKISCGENMSLSASVTQLSPSTTYYVRAYAVSSLGTVYSSEISFKTSARDSDSQIDKEDWGEDNDWNDDNTEIGRDGYQDDENWN